MFVDDRNEINGFADALLTELDEVVNVLCRKKLRRCVRIGFFENLD